MHKGQSESAEEEPGGDDADQAKAVKEVVEEGDKGKLDGDEDKAKTDGENGAARKRAPLRVALSFYIIWWWWGLFSRDAQRNQKSITDVTCTRTRKA